MASSCLAKSSPVFTNRLQRISEKEKNVYVVRDRNNFLGTTTMTKSYVYAFRDRQEAEGMLLNVETFRDDRGRWPSCKELPNAPRPCQEEPDAGMFT